MMENNDRLLEEFLAAGRQEIADNGFSRRVMHSLPSRSRGMAQWWSIGGFTLVVVLFVMLDGLQLVANAFLDAFRGMLEQDSTVDPRSLAIAVVVLLFVAYKKIASLA